MIICWCWGVYWWRRLSTFFFFEVDDFRWNAQWRSCKQITGILPLHTHFRPKSFTVPLLINIYPYLWKYCKGIYMTWTCWHVVILGNDVTSISAACFMCRLLSCNIFLQVQVESDSAWTYLKVIVYMHSKSDWFWGLQCNTGNELLYLSLI